MAKESNSQLDSSTKSLDTVLSRVEENCKILGLGKEGTGKEVFRKFADEVGWRLAIDSLITLQQTDPKGYLQMFGSMVEYITPKNTRTNGESAKGLSISFNMPSDRAIESPIVKENISVASQYIEPINIVIADRSKSS